MHTYTRTYMHTHTRTYMHTHTYTHLGFPGGKEPGCLPGDITDVDPIPRLGQEDPLEEGMATHASILAWRIPWTEELGGLQSKGSQRIAHD